VTGHPVSHDTALPDRLAPYTSVYRIPLRSISRPNAARRRRISETENENPGFSHADTLRCWTRTRTAATTASLCAPNQTRRRRPKLACRVASAAGSVR
jgi:hypothetical protein